MKLTKSNSLLYANARHSQNIIHVQQDLVFSQSWCFSHSTRMWMCSSQNEDCLFGASTGWVDFPWVVLSRCLDYLTNSDVVFYIVLFLMLWCFISTFSHWNYYWYQDCIVAFIYEKELSRIWQRSYGKVRCIRQIMNAILVDSMCILGPY